MAKMIRSRLYPIGTWKHQDTFYLVVDEDGIVYTILVDVPVTAESGRDDHLESEMEAAATSFERFLEYFLSEAITARMLREQLAGCNLLDKVWTLNEVDIGEESVDN